MRSKTTKICVVSSRRVLSAKFGFPVTFQTFRAGARTAMGNQVTLFDRDAALDKYRLDTPMTLKVCAQRHLRRVTIPLRSRHPSEELLSSIAEAIRCGLRREKTSSNEKALAS